MNPSIDSDTARDVEDQTCDRIVKFRRDYRRWNAAKKIVDNVANHGRRLNDHAGIVELIAASLAFVRHHLQFNRRLAFVIRHITDAGEARHGVKESSHARGLGAIYVSLSH